MNAQTAVVSARRHTGAVLRAWPGTWRRALPVIVAVALAAPWFCVTRAMELPLDPRAIQAAISIGQSRLAQDRDQYHRPYRVVVSRAPVDYVEIVTPFRRVELAAESRAAAGDRGFGQRQALELLAAETERVDVHVELTFHPLNTYVGVPEYQVVLIGAGSARPIEPLTLDRIPRYGARVDTLARPSPAPSGPVLPGGSQPMLGGTVIARFDAAMLEPKSAYDVVISEGGRREGATAGPVLARARADLALMR